MSSQRQEDIYTQLRDYTSEEGQSDAVWSNSLDIVNAVQSALPSWLPAFEKTVNDYASSTAVNLFLGTLSILVFLKLEVMAHVVPSGNPDIGGFFTYTGPERRRFDGTIKEKDILTSLAGGHFEKLESIGCGKPPETPKMHRKENSGRKRKYSGGSSNDDGSDGDNDEGGEGGNDEGGDGGNDEGGDGGNDEDGEEDGESNNKEWAAATHYGQQVTYQCKLFYDFFTSLSFQQQPEQHVLDELAQTFVCWANLMFMYQSQAATEFQHPTISNRPPVTNGLYGPWYRQLWDHAPVVEDNMARLSDQSFTRKRQANRVILMAGVLHDFLDVASNFIHARLTHSPLSRIDVDKMYHFFDNSNDTIRENQNRGKSW